VNPLHVPPSGASGFPNHSIAMPPFRNLLNRKNQPNGGDADGLNENHLSPTRAAPIEIRRSCDGEPNEYKLSGRDDSSLFAYSHISV
jgi:hypothetical protein